ncbi:hypothetical protein J5N97_027536 [Dioscorea zingiberensis]|uniref:Cupin type-1 domain-containing protein n=1 Tax=Dioscorea zingiberensis TaxID=325984 RepID=A0A9D5C4W5_9LILI|nr:hypothetical protein J5N97_027536 [Dioscorea zingiberensis]
MATISKPLLSLLLFCLLLLSQGLQEQQDPQQKLQQCRQRCQQQEQGHQQRCMQRCQEEYKKEQGERGQQEERGESHYVFQKEKFFDGIRTQHGYVRVLPNFSELSRLLSGISIYRLAVLNLNPQAVLLPLHLDAEMVLYVVQGRGSVGVVNSESRESHEVRQGDILRLRSGSIFYLANKDNNEKLTIVKLMLPISRPGQFRLRPEEVQKLFEPQQQQQQQGAIIKASEQQIRSIGGSSSHQGGESQRPFNLLKKRPTESNRHGKLIRADRNDYQPLKDLDLAVSFVNITQRSMFGPRYSTQSYEIAVVTQGDGTVEIICPHLASQKRESEQEQGSEGEQEREGEQEEGEQQQYERVRSRVTEGTAIVFPPGHPAVEIASSDKNLQVVRFEIRAEGNQQVFLAGPNSPWRRMEDGAKELAFGMKAREVDQRLDRQKETAFVPGPEERERDSPLYSVVNFFDF